MTLNVDLPNWLHRDVPGIKKVPVVTTQRSTVPVIMCPACDQEIIKSHLA